MLPENVIPVENTVLIPGTAPTSVPLRPAASVTTTLRLARDVKLDRPSFTAIDVTDTHALASPADDPTRPDIDCPDIADDADDTIVTL